MTFLYSSLGILLFSGILLISKHTLLFSQKNYHSNYYSSIYISSKSQQVDQFILNIMLDKNIDLGFNDQICFNLKHIIANSGLLKKNEFEYVVFPKTKSSHLKLVNSCVLTNGMHRILIKRDPKEFRKYLLNSCIISNKQYCDFEKES